MGAVLAVRLVRFVESALGVDAVVEYHIDSTVVFGWIRRPPEDVFVRNRVRELLLHSGPEQWSHVPGTQNPADLATRGVSLRELASSILWRHGPPRAEGSLSLRVQPQRPAVRPSESLDPDPLALFQRLASFARVRRICAYVLRVKQRFRRDEACPKSPPPPSPQELATAQEVLLRYAQLNTQEFEELSSPPCGTPVLRAIPAPASSCATPARGETLSRGCPRARWLLSS
jgi:hypothetical protein